MRRSGWLAFSAIVMMVAGIGRVLDGIWAFRYNGPTADNLQNAIFGRSLNTYGWIWLIGGVLLFASGIFLLTSKSAMAGVARWIGIVVAGLAAIASVSWLPYYPVWSLVYVGLSIAVIYGLIAHFDEVETT